MKKMCMIKKQSEFLEVTKLGQRYMGDLFTVCFMKNDIGYNKFAFVVRKNIGNAVLRNRIKRLIKESIRLNLDSLKIGYNISITARPKSQYADFNKVMNCMNHCLRKTGLLLKRE